MMASVFQVLAALSSGAVAAFMVPSAGQPWFEPVCPGCQVSDNPGQPGGTFVIDYNEITKEAGTCVLDGGTADANDCKPASKCKVKGALGVTNNSPAGSNWQITESINGNSKELTAGFNAYLMGGDAAIGSQFPCGGNITLTIQKTDTPGDVATLKWSCPACPKDAPEGT